MNAIQQCSYCNNSLSLPGVSNGNIIFHFPTLRFAYKYFYSTTEFISIAHPLYIIKRVISKEAYHRRRGRGGDPGEGLHRRRHLRLRLLQCRVQRRGVRQRRPLLLQGVRVRRQEGHHQQQRRPKNIFDRVDIKVFLRIIFPDPRPPIRARCDQP